VAAVTIVVVVCVVVLSGLGAEGIAREGVREGAREYMRGVSYSATDGPSQSKVMHCMGSIPSCFTTGEHTVGSSVSSI
jgi:hypothetical protein